MQYLADSSSALLVCAGLLSLAGSLTSRLSAACGIALTYAAFFFHSASMAQLIYLRVTDNFEFAHVYHNSHTTQLLLYKIFGVWGNYEGSNLLFSWLLSAYAALLALLISQESLKRIALLVQNLLSFGFTLFGVVFANPFLKIVTLDADGLGFNPMLQDVGLTIHPPMLLGGYAGFSAVFSMTIAALILRTDPKEWAITIRSWVLSAWAILTVGIALGGWWAYRELGWGGFWSWDPVENVSLMPWFLGTALIHMIPVVRKNRIYCNFALLLAVSAFVCGLCGTFLVRSGFLLSVHTFANDPARGVFLLGLVATVAIIGFLVFIVRYRDFEETGNFGYISKISAIIANSVTMLTAFFVVLTGTVYPVILELWTENTVSVGEHYYNSVFGALSVILLVPMIVLPCLSWDGNQSFRLKFKISAFCAVLAIPFALPYGLTGMLILLSALLIASTLEDCCRGVRNSSVPLRESIRHIRLGRCAMLTAHLGIAVFMLGAICSTMLCENVAQYMKEHESVDIRGFRITLSGVSLVKKQHYEAIRVEFTVARHGGTVHKLFPESRFYYVEGVRNTESSIYHRLLADIYIVVGDVDKHRGIAVQVHYKPLIAFVWIGLAMIAVGGAMAAINALLRKRQHLDWVAAEGAGV
ncbi:MAG: heme lyase CcmF/NrfE family subunit [Anaplasma sp.]